MTTSPKQTFTATQLSKRARILVAANRLIGAQGLRATTMAAIASAAGIAKPTLYTYFADKDAVLRACAISVMDEVEQAAFGAAAACEGDAVDKSVAIMQAWVGKFFDRLMSLPHAEECLQWQDSVAAAHYTLLRERLESELNALIETLPAHHSQAQARATLIIRACNGLKLEATDRAQLMDDIRRVIVGVLRLP